MPNFIQYIYIDFTEIKLRLGKYNGSVCLLSKSGAPSVYFNCSGIDYKDFLLKYNTIKGQR